MPIMGKHRRFKSASLTRGFIAVSTGGVVLALPLIGAGSASAAPAHPVAAEKAAASTSVAAKEIAVHKAESTAYSVASGDSLYKIAQGHSLSGGWERLYKDNRSAVGANPDLIHPGLKLTIGAKSAAVAPKAAPTAESKATTTESKPAVEAKDATDASQSSDRSEGTDRADRSQRTVTPIAEKAAATAPAEAATTYTDDLDGWINESLAVMAQNGIPGSYDSIYRNVIRESSGNPQIVNGWDSNAVAGTPSKGLLQVIQPTFDAYHVPGTSTDILDPVANITAACNYAAATYGSIDNVFGAY